MPRFNNDLSLPSSHIPHHRPPLSLFIWVPVANDKLDGGDIWVEGGAFCGVGGISYCVGEVNNRLTEK